MPTNYDGIPGNITAPSAINIASSTATNPASITVSGTLPADFLTGIKVHIDGHQANEVINGIYPATVTGASSFTIPVNASASIAGGATGTVQPLNLTAFYQIPSDGDADNEASIDTWAKATGDRTQYLAADVGQFKLARKEIFLFSDLTGTTWCHFGPAGATAGTPAQFTTDAAASFGTLIGAALAAPVTGQPPIFAIRGATSGDIVICRFQTAFGASPGDPVRLLLYAAVMRPGITLPNWPADYGGGVAQGGSAIIHPDASGDQIAVTVECRAQVNVNGCNVFVQPAFLPLNSGSQTHSLDGDTMLTIDIWRPTGFPQ